MADDPDATTEDEKAKAELPKKHPRFLFHFHHHSNAHGWVRVGLDSSIIATIAVITLPAWPIILSLFGLVDSEAGLDKAVWLWRWAWLLYFFLQVAEIAARNPIEQGQVLRDDIYSLGPSVAATVMLFLSWFVIYLPPQCADALWFALVTAWADVILGRALVNRIMGQPYQRGETELHR